MSGLTALTGWDLEILIWIASHCRTAFLDALMPAVSALGNGGLVWILLGLGILLLHRGQRSTGFQVLLALLFSLLLCNLLVKNLVDRPRPFELVDSLPLLIPPPGDASFPSGHTSASAAAVTVLFLCRWRWRWVPLILGAMIALSRLYLCVHFLTDVLGGMALGMLCGWLAVTLWRKCLRPWWEVRYRRIQRRR